MTWFESFLTRQEIGSLIIVLMGLGALVFVGLQCWFVEWEQKKARQRGCKCHFCESKRKELRELK